MPRARHVVSALFLLLTVAACKGSDNPAAPDTTITGADTGFAFTYTPPAGAPAITSIAVPGDFNNWSTTAAPMKKQSDGSWVEHVPNLASGRYTYKFYINGAWPSDMCDNRTWGDPAKSYWIDADAIGCTDDGVGGENAVIDVGNPTIDLAFSHDPQNPAQLSAAGGRLSVRFAVSQGPVQSATLHAGGQAGVRAGCR